jgi:plastocyanin domain-containing protein
MRLLIVLVSAAVLLAGCEKKADPAAKSDPAPAAAADKSAIPITVDGDGFKPSAVKFKKGAPATLIFTRTTDDTCATEVVFPQLDIKKELPKGKAVSITIPTDKEQTLTFQCGMGMYKSSVVVAVN